MKEQFEEQGAQQMPDTSDGNDGDGGQKRAVKLFGHEFDKKKTRIVQALLGLLFFTIAGGGICYAVSQQPQDGKPPIEQTERDGKAVDLVKKNIKANPNADEEKVEEESKKAEEAVTDEPSGGSTGASKPETGGNSGSTGNGGDSGYNDGSGNGGGGNKPQHTHNWIPQTTVMHHDAQYKTIHHDAVYKTGVECNGCHTQFDSYDAWLAHSDSQLDNGNYNCMGYHTVNIVISPAWDETVEVSPAWDETVTTGYTCPDCGAVK